MKYLVRVISIEPFGNPTHYKVLARIIGTAELLTVTLPFEPWIAAGEETTFSLG